MAPVQAQGDPRSSPGFVDTCALSSLGLYENGSRGKRVDDLRPPSLGVCQEGKTLSIVCGSAASSDCPPAGAPLTSVR